MSRLLRSGQLLGWSTQIQYIGRSEEHTSELQSQSNLVCRLLLEKKSEANGGVAVEFCPRVIDCIADALAEGVLQEGDVLGAHAVIFVGVAFLQNTCILLGCATRH